MTDYRILDLGAGAGGWSQALKALGRSDVLGIEKDTTICTTAELAGHARLQGDMTVLDPLHVGKHMGGVIEGIVASPPCTTFSAAGLGEGRPMLAALQKAANEFRGVPITHYQLLQIVGDARTAMALEPLRYIQSLMPDWVAMEQVPAILPLFETMALLMRDWGFNVWTGYLHAEQYGVPQARKRAILIACWQDIVQPPRATHSKYHSRDPQKLDPGVLPYVTAGEALGWTQIPASRIYNQSGTTVDVDWVARRPSTTVVGRDILRHPGATTNATNGATSSRNDGVVLTQSEAGVLQTFPADYPWTGSKRSQFLQIGNAIPPVLAEAVLRQLVTP